MAVPATDYRRLSSHGVLAPGLRLRGARRFSFLLAGAWLVAGLPGSRLLAQDSNLLPQYEPERQVTGTIRNYGSSLNGLMEVWEKGFARYQPGVRFDDKFPSSDGAFSGLESGLADLGTSGREAVLTEYLSFNETFGYDPTEIAVATGAYDLAGRSWAVVIFVHKDNPIPRLTMRQLDGIFGSERTGGYHGMKWMPQVARGPEQNIRTWGQLGLTGEWADKPIQTYGYAFTGMANFFQLQVFHGGQKWNPNYREYVEDGTKMVSAGEIGQTGSIRHMFTAELAHDKYGIAWSGIPQAAGVPEVKLIALAEDDGKPYVLPTKASVQNRTYPLARSIYILLKRPPGQPVASKEKEFLRYILSRQGQEDVIRQNNYLPLTAAVVGAQLKKLE